MIQAVLTDIEGTTSSLSFVKDVLFPYARSQLREFVLRNQGRPEIQALLQDTRMQMPDLQASTEAVVEQLIGWIDQDKKITPLKTLQGLIWEEGYRKGDFHGHIYPDAVDKLKEWHAHGIRLYVYSSGSIHAQKLLFAHTEFGDLTYLFSGYFDTHIGHKREVDSYRKIAEEIKTAPPDVLFLSDIREELEAAETTGMEVILLDRQQNTGFSGFPVVSRFDQIQLT